MCKLPYPTAHIDAAPADFAKTVLMPGDPLRAKFLAETYLTDAVLVNNVRGIGGYTGYYKGTRLSVMASGMGMPSMGIYSHELFHFFGVDNILRVGTAGAMHPDVHLYDVVFGLGACTDSNYAAHFHLPGTFAPICSYSLLSAAIQSAQDLGIPFRAGNLLSTDAFYHDEDALPKPMRTAPQWSKMGVLAVEMEAAALYMNAARAGKNALAICSISDHLITGEKLSAQQRRTSFTQMMEIALNVAVKMSKAKECSHE